MTLSPVVLFVYNRLDHTRRTIDALRKNELAQESELIVFSDAPVSEEQVEDVNKVRQYIHNIEGFKSITIVEREFNLGLAKSIIDGVTKIVEKHGKIIVLEDDLVTSKYFLSYMNEALNKYADNNEVISIHGYVYPVAHELPEAFFLPGADCWGWATWRRGWSLFNSDGQYLLNELARLKLLKAFDFNDSYSYSKMLEGQTKGTNDSWAIRWYASAFLANKLTLYPGRSLVNNIGNDDSGTHCSDSNSHESALSDTPINLDNVNIEVSQTGLAAFESFFLSLKRGLIYRVLHKLKLI